MPPGDLFGASGSSAQVVPRGRQASAQVPAPARPAPSAMVYWSPRLRARGHRVIPNHLSPGGIESRRWAGPEPGTPGSSAVRGLWHSRIFVGRVKHTNPWPGTEIDVFHTPDD